MQLLSFVGTIILNYDVFVLREVKEEKKSVIESAFELGKRI